MFLDFMKPDVWNGLVIGVTLIGVALAVLRLMNDRAYYQRKQQAEVQQAGAHEDQPEQSHNE